MTKNLLLGVFVMLSFISHAQTVVFEETFNNDSPTVSSWEVIDRDGDTGEWYLRNSLPAMINWGFSGRVMISYSLFGSPDNLLVSPVIALPLVNQLSLSYQVTSRSDLPAEHYAVYILPSTASFTGNETPVFEETLTVDDTETASLKTIDLSSFAGQSVKIYYRHFNCEQDFLILDNVKVTESNVLASQEINKSKIEIYPSLVKDYLTIRSKAKVSKIEVFNMSGRKMQVESDHHKINVQHLQSGNYTLKIKTEKGDTTHKFIKI